MRHRYQSAANSPMLDALLLFALFGLLVVAIASVLNMSYTDAFRSFGNTLVDAATAVGSAIRNAVA